MKNHKLNAQANKPGQKMKIVQAFLEDLFGCRVDVVTKAALDPYIRDQVLKEAVPL